MSVKEDNQFDTVSDLARIGVENFDRILPLIDQTRQEQKHAQQLVDDIVDKLLDTGKFLVGIGAPATVAVYALKSSELGARNNCSARS